MTKPLTHIVFTRNRPLQVAGFLDSILRHRGSGVEATISLYEKDLVASEFKQVLGSIPSAGSSKSRIFTDDVISGGTA